MDVQVSLDDGDADDLDVATGALRRELLELDVEGVRRPTAAAPDGTRGGAAAELGSLVVSIASQPAIVTAVLATVGRWVKGRDTRRARIQIGDDVLELEGVSTDDQQRLLDAFVARHAGGPSATGDAGG